MMKKVLLGLALCVAATLAMAQVPGLFIASPTGNEQIEVLVPSTGTVVTNPQKQQVTINQIRNTTGYLLSALTTGTVTTTASVDNVILTAAATTLTVNLPANPPDASLFSVTNGTTSTYSGTITVAATDSSTIVGSVSLVNLAAASGAEYQYTLAAKTWYRLR